MTRDGRPEPMTKVDAARDSLTEAVEIMQRSVDCIERAHLRQEIMRRVRAEHARAEQEGHAPPR